MAKRTPWTLALALGASLAYAAPGPEVVATHAFLLVEGAEVIASLEAECAGCAWGRAGREAAALRVLLDGNYSQHLLLVRGEEPSAYRISLGAMGAGSHTLTFEVDRAWTPRGVEAARVSKVATEAVMPLDPRHAWLAHAPVLCARPNTIRRFTDLPILEWVETDARPEGRRLRYSVIFTNEDGGTPADRLLATWGRLTDIEYVYSVELDASNRVGVSEYQGKDHVVRPFAGRREGRHPLIHVVTDNNMVSDEGTCEVRFTLVPRPFELTGTSREAVMDDEPWSYHVSSEEARREGRVVAGSKPGDKTIVDPRRYAYVEACAPTQDAGITFSLGVATEAGIVFKESDGGLGKFLIQRERENFPNGCFRGAVALPEGATGEAIRALRFRAHTRPAHKDESPLAPGTGAARLLRVNKVFLLGPGDVPGKNLFSWTGDLAMTPEGSEVELKIGG